MSRAGQRRSCLALTGAGAKGSEGDPCRAWQEQFWTQVSSAGSKLRAVPCTEPTSGNSGSRRCKHLFLGPDNQAGRMKCPPTPEGGAKNPEGGLSAAGRGGRRWQKVGEGGRSTWQRGVRGPAGHRCRPSGPGNLEKHSLTKALALLLSRVGSWPRVARHSKRQKGQRAKAC